MAIPIAVVVVVAAVVVAVVEDGAGQIRLPLGATMPGSS